MEVIAKIKWVPLFWTTWYMTLAEASLLLFFCLLL